MKRKQQFKQSTVLKKTTTIYKKYSEVYLDDRPLRTVWGRVVHKAQRKQATASKIVFHQFLWFWAIDQCQKVAHFEKIYPQLHAHWYLVIPGMVEASWENFKEKRNIALKLGMEKWIMADTVFLFGCMVTSLYESTCLYYT